MNFLYPGFLFALLAVVIPIVIHLFNFRKFKEIYFSNVAFLREVKEQNSSREKLKNLLVLISRMLAIIFLVLAFARPFRSNVDAATFSKANMVSIYIDNSYSMGAVNKEGSLLDEAKRKAKEIVNSYAINDKFQLLTNDFEGQHQRLLNSSEFLQALENVKISPANKIAQQVINRQQSIFTGQYNRFAYLISDFQLGFVGQELIKKDSTTRVSLVKLAANAIPNIAVDSVWLLSPVQKPNTSEKIVVRVKNLGGEEVKNIPIKLTINNQQKAISSVSIKGYKAITDTISYNGLSAGWQKGSVSIKDFPITFDDELKFSFQVNAHQEVLAINGEPSPSLQALFSADSYFKYTAVAENTVNYGTLQRYSLIIINGLKNPSTGLANELKNYLNSGGSVIIFPNTEIDLAVFSVFLTTLGLPAVQELTTEPTKVSSIALQHQLFKGVFEQLPKNLDLPNVNRYFSYQDGSRRVKENLLNLPAGKTFLAKYGVNNGEVFLAASGLIEKDGNLIKHPLFVPLMYKIAFESAQQLPLFYTITEDNLLTLPAVKLGINQSITLHGESFEAIPELRQKQTKTLLYLADQVKKPGFYQVQLADSVLAVVAFNSNRDESDMRFASEEALKAQFGDNNGVQFISTQKENISSAIAVKNNGTELWKLCLILSLVFIATEIVLVRLSTTKKTKSNEPLN